MGTVFYEATLRGRVGVESVDNVFWYSAISPLGDDPTNTEVIAAAENIGFQMGTDWVTKLPTTYTLVDCYVRPFKADGTPGTAVPQAHALGMAGGLAGDRDGNALVSIFHCVLGGIVKLNSLSAELRRAYFAYGPALNSMVQDDNSINPISLPVLTGVAQTVAVTRNLVTVPYYFPIKVSKTASHALTPNITAYREIVTAFCQPYASVRVSRKNNR